MASMMPSCSGIRPWCIIIGLLISNAASFTPVTSIRRVRRQERRQARPRLAVITSEAQQQDTSGDNLTKEELSLRFIEVRDYYFKTNTMTQENVSLSMLRTRLPHLALNRCHVAPSTIVKAGLGLFASRNVDKDELITLFPGDALLVWKNGIVGDFTPHDNVGCMFGEHVQGANRDASRVSSNEARLYELEILKGHSLVADPLLVEDRAYLGHMINDSAALVSKSNASRTLYSKTSFDRHNAAFRDCQGCHLTVTATRDIMENEEIFVSYGEGYWLSRTTAGATSKSNKGAKTRGSKKTKGKGGGGFA